MIFLERYKWNPAINGPSICVHVPAKIGRQNRFIYILPLSLKAACPAGPPQLWVYQNQILDIPRMVPPMMLPITKDHGNERITNQKSLKISPNSQNSLRTSQMEKRFVLTLKKVKYDLNQSFKGRLHLIPRAPRKNQDSTYHLQKSLIGWVRVEGVPKTF